MKDFEMTEDQLATLMDSMKAVPLIAIHCGNGVSQQERANNAWKVLGNQMGFIHSTVSPNGKGQRFFTAEPVHCKGIEIGDGNFSGCDQSSGDCPVCGK